jgi:hypothetical protein
MTHTELSEIRAWRCQLRGQLNEMEKVWFRMNNNAVKLGLTTELYAILQDMGRLDRAMRRRVRE